jgi:hypothetical protein
MLDTSRLSERDAGIIGRALRASVDGPFFPEWEFQTLFGLSRDQVRAVADAWPRLLPELVTETAVCNALNNLSGYPTGGAGHLSSYGLDRDQLLVLLRRIQHR